MYKALRFFQGIPHDQSYSEALEFSTTTVLTVFTISAEAAH